MWARPTASTQIVILTHNNSLKHRHVPKILFSVHAESHEGKDKPALSPPLEWSLFGAALYCPSWLHSRTAADIIESTQLSFCNQWYWCVSIGHNKQSHHFTWIRAFPCHWCAALSYALGMERTCKIEDSKRLQGQILGTSKSYYARRHITSQYSDAG